MSKHAPKGTLHVYEVRNYDRRESLVALVADGLVRFVNRLESPRPPPVAHWGPKEAIIVELLHAALPTADAEAYVKVFLSKSRSKDWKMFVWRG